MRTYRIAVFVLCAFPCGSVSAQDSRSAQAVRSLTAVMSMHQQTAIAAKDPDTGEFVAALFFPGVQLLVVSAPSSASAFLDEQIAEKNFQEVYVCKSRERDQQCGSSERVTFVLDHDLSLRNSVVAVSHLT
jgi:hypothetical protein